MTKRKSLMWIPVVGALGVVFGDIGTSPLYAFQSAFEIKGHHIAVNQLDVLGLISLIIWSITIIVSIKFIGFIMRYGNQNEGGIMALISMVRSSRLAKHKKWFFLGLGLMGAALFYGDGAITPAISVLSAVEGVKVITPHLDRLIVPVSLLILAVLFWLQKYGTSVVGKLFGPVMLLWFIAIGAAGAWQITKYTHVLYALSPYTAIHFFVARPILAFLSMTAVVLAITGAEALYADMGHFGRPPIAKAWFFVVFPALTLCYLGQGGMILHGAKMNENLLVQMFPTFIRIPAIILATVATIIASQSVISGVFSITRQSINLDYLPKMLIRYTSKIRIGQIYIPLINSILFVLVAALILIFRSSANLANAYGIAVSGTLLADTILFLVVAKNLFKKSLTYVFALIIVFLPLDILFVSSNSIKIFHGGLFPIIVGVLVCIVLYTWHRGDAIVESKRRSISEPLQVFEDKIHNAKIPIRRVPGYVIYIGHHEDLVPLALSATLNDLHELPSKVVIVTVNKTASAHVPLESRATFIENPNNMEGIYHLSLHYGYHDTINVPKDIEPIIGTTSKFNFDLDQAAYFVSQSKLVINKKHNLAHWRKTLFAFLYRNSIDTADFYKLPSDRTEDMQALITL